MVVGAALVELHVHGSTSLKQKRGVIRSIQQRVRNRFNVSVAEVGGQDTWQRCVIGLSAAGGEPAPVRKVLQRAVAFIESLHLAEVRSSDMEILVLPEVAESPPDDLEGLPWGEGPNEADEADEADEGIAEEDPTGADVSRVD